MRAHSIPLLTPTAAALLLLPLASFTAAEEGFEPLFDGETLSGWDGNPGLWRVADGAIVGETTDSDPIEENEFLIWDGQVDDFVLRLKFRVADHGAGNSGVQYRSQRVEGGGRWAVGGYQADIERTNKHMGILYEERGRGIIAKRGEKVRLVITDDGFKKEVIGSVGDPTEIVEGVKPGEWQELEIVAEGNRLEHKINGRTTALVFDEDKSHSSQSGIVALQVHRGPAMKIEFKEIRLKQLGARTSE